MELMISQKNELLGLIREYGLEPFNFKWNKEGGDSTLRYKDTDFGFAVNIVPGVFNCTYSPGESFIYDREKVYIWDDVVSIFMQWLSCLKREISQPDLWKELEKIKMDDLIPELDGFEFEDKYEREEFSYREVMQIEQGINDIGNYLVEISNGNDEEIQIINQKIDYLTDAVKRMGRTDWKNIFIGVMIDIGINIISDPVQRQIIGQMIQNMFSGIVKLISIQ